VQDLTGIVMGSSGDDSEEGEVDHDSMQGDGGPDQWSHPGKNWHPFSVDGNFAGFKLVEKEVPPLAAFEPSASERSRAFKAFKTFSSLLVGGLDGVKIQVQNLGVTSLRDRWVRVSRGLLLARETFLGLSRVMERLPRGQKT